MVKQVKDSAGAVVPLLGYAQGGGQSVIFTTSTSNVSTAISTSIVSITPSTNCFIETGDANVTADANTAHFLLGSVIYDVSMGAERMHTHIAVIGADEAGTLYISERG